MEQTTDIIENITQLSFHLMTLLYKMGDEEKDRIKEIEQDLEKLIIELENKNV